MDEYVLHRLLDCVITLLEVEPCPLWRLVLRAYKARLERFIPLEDVSWPMMTWSKN